MPDHVRVLNLARLFSLSWLVVPSPPARAVGWARSSDALRSRVFAGVRVARHHRIGHVMPHLDRGAHRAAERRAEQPVADADDAVPRQSGDSAEVTMVAVSRAKDEAAPANSEAPATRRRRDGVDGRRIMAGSSDRFRCAPRGQHPTRHRPRSAGRRPRRAPWRCPGPRHPRRPGRRARCGAAGRPLAQALLHDGGAAGGIGGMPAANSASMRAGRSSSMTRVPAATRTGWPLSVITSTSAAVAAVLNADDTTTHDARAVPTAATAERRWNGEPHAAGVLGMDRSPNRTPTPPRSATKKAHRSHSALGQPRKEAGAGLPQG